MPSTGDSNEEEDLYEQMNCPNSMVRQPCWLDGSCLVLLRRIFLSEATRARRFLFNWMFTAVEHAFVTFLVPPLRICACVWTGTFWAHVIRHWRDPLFSSARDPIIIPGRSYINSTATWRMRTVHHTSKSEREPNIASSTNYRRPR